MQLIAAQDEGRLSGDIRLRSLFQTIDTLPPKPASEFVRSIESLGDGVVLFWHEDAELALEALGDLQQSGTWPKNLHGVVIFRASDFAGFSDQKTTDAALERFGIDRRRVHILKSPVLDWVPIELAEGIVNFATALKRLTPTFPPFGFLQPPDQNDAALTLLIVDWLIRANPDLGQRVMQAASWVRIGENLEIAFGHTPPANIVQTAASNVRARSATCADKCDLCGRRAHLHHLAEKLSPTATNSVAELRSLVLHAISLFDSARSIEDEVLSTTRNALLIEDLGDADPILLQILREQLRDQCRLQQQFRDELLRIESIVKADLLGLELQAAIQDFCNAIRCKATFGFRF